MKTACENYAKYGRVTNFSKGTRPSKNIPSDVLEWLTGVDGLREYRFLSLVQRSHRIWDRFAIQIGPNALKRLYSRAGIDYTWSRPQTRPIIEDPNTVPDRREAAMHLKHLLAANEPIVFIDETSLRVSHPS